MRIGHGFDVHGFEAGDALVLGGVSIPFNSSFKAHSDGDVLIHALIDAMLGAAGEGDIGQHFPDNDARFKNIDSRDLLRQTYNKIESLGFELSNADLTIVAQAPKLVSFLSDMKENLASDLNVKANCLNIKATTTEGLGFVGRGEGIAVHAVILLRASS